MVDRNYQLIVVGGGINGAGIARDAALRRIKTLLIEKEDFATGATGGSSGMIHGGLRYMISDVHTTRKSCVDSGYIQKIAPNLLFRIPFLYPFKEKDSKIMIELFETYFEAYDFFAPLKNGKPHARLSAKEVRELEPEISEDISGAVTMDEFGIDPYRLTVANVVSAAEAGADVMNHTIVTGFLKDGNRVTGVKIRNTITGEYGEYHGDVVFNATGPWLMKVADIAGVDIKIRPSKGVHLVLDRRFSNNGIIVKAIDGRSIFIMPHENNSIIGTTDDDYFGDLDNVPVLHDEVEYLLSSIETVIPRIRETRIIRAYTGIRPTLYTYGIYEDDLSRDHRVYNHGETDNLKGLYSIAGGKLAAYRLMSKEAVDIISKELKVRRKCRTHKLPLPGGDKKVDPLALAGRYGISPYLAGKLIFRHGSRSEEILELAKEIDNGFFMVCPSEQVIKAEIVYVMDREFAVTLSDVSRRTRLGMGPGGGRSAFIAAEIMREHKDEDSSYRSWLVREFLNHIYKLRKSILADIQLGYEEVIQGELISNTGLRYSEWGE